MQVFRLVKSGVVDKVIAFDELPKRLLDGVEMRRPDGFPRHWKEFIGKHEKYTPASPEKNPFTGKVEMVGEKREVEPFFFVLFYQEINKDKERWEEISSFVRRAVDLKFRLMDRLEDMALPLSTDAAAELKLEPEEFEAKGSIIPIPLEFQEKTPTILDKDGNAIPTSLPDKNIFKCQECDKTFENERGLQIHGYRKHKKETIPA